MINVRTPHSTLKAMTLPEDYSESDFSNALRKFFRPEIIDTLGENFLVFGFTQSGAIVQMPLTGLQNGSSVFLYNDKFCDEELLGLLETIGESDFAPPIAYTGVFSYNGLIAKLANLKYKENLEKIIGIDLEEMFMKIEDQIKNK